MWGVCIVALKFSWYTDFLVSSHTQETSWKGRMLALMSGRDCMIIVQLSWNKVLFKSVVLHSRCLEMGVYLWHSEETMHSLFRSLTAHRFLSQCIYTKEMVLKCRFWGSDCMNIVRSPETEIFELVELHSGDVLEMVSCLWDTGEEIPHFQVLRDRALRQ